MELAGNAAQFFGVGREALLTPSVSDAAQDAHQRYRCRYQDSLAQSPFQKLAVPLESRGQEMLAWQEHYHHFRIGLELRPILPRGEPRHVAAKLLGVPVKSGCSPRRFRCAF